MCIRTFTQCNRASLFASRSVWLPFNLDPELDWGIPNPWLNPTPRLFFSDGWADPNGPPPLPAPAHHPAHSPPLDALGPYPGAALRSVRRWGAQISHNRRQNAPQNCILLSRVWGNSHRKENHQPQRNIWDNVRGMDLRREEWLDPISSDPIPISNGSSFTPRGIGLVFFWGAIAVRAAFRWKRVSHPLVGPVHLSGCLFSIRFGWCGHKWIAERNTDCISRIWCFPTKWFISLIFDSNFKRIYMWLRWPIFAQFFSATLRYCPSFSLLLFFQERHTQSIVPKPLPIAFHGVFPPWKITPFFHLHLKWCLEFLNWVDKVNLFFRTKTTASRVVPFFLIFFPPANVSPVILF